MGQPGPGKGGGCWGASGCGARFGMALWGVPVLPSPKPGLEMGGQGGRAKQGVQGGSALPSLAPSAPSGSAFWVCSPEEEGARGGRWGKTGGQRCGGGSLRGLCCLIAAGLGGGSQPQAAPRPLRGRKPTPSPSPVPSGGLRPLPGTTMSSGLLRSPHNGVQHWGLPELPCISGTVRINTLERFTPMQLRDPRLPPTVLGTHVPTPLEVPGGMQGFWGRLGGSQPVPRALGEVVARRESLLGRWRGCCGADYSQLPSPRLAPRR